MLSTRPGRHTVGSAAARAGLIAVGSAWLLTGLVATGAPRAFFAGVPGLAAMGGYNGHLVRDVGLAFVASGMMMLAGAIGRRHSLIWAGLSWPALHALFHAQTWAAHGFLLDRTFGFDLLAVMLPVGIAAGGAAALNGMMRR